MLPAPPTSLGCREAASPGGPRGRSVRPRRQVAASPRAPRPHRTPGPRARTPFTVPGSALPNTGSRRLWAGPSKSGGQRVAPERRGQLWVPARHSRLRDPPHSPQGCGGVRRPGADRGRKAGRGGAAGPGGAGRPTPGVEPSAPGPLLSARVGCPRDALGPRLHGAPAWPALLAAAPARGCLLRDPGRPVLLGGGVAPGAPNRSQNLLCRHPLSLAVQRHPRFRNLFNLSTPVLLSGDLFTPQLWDSLSQHKAPYGWQGLSHQAITSTLSLLNGSESTRLFAVSRELLPGCIRCAVVGNGGILNGSRQGQNIDAHDYVFRLNGAVIKGFENDVGTKISFYGFTVNTMKNSLISYSNVGFTSVPQGQYLRYIFIPSDIRDYLMLRSAILGVPVPEGTDKGDRPQTYFGLDSSASKFRLLHPDFISYLTERFLKSKLINTKFGDLYMPSTGALMLLTALHTCDQVSAYGFITSNYQKFSDHYFDRMKKPLIFYANHDLSLEATLWRDLHKAGILWLYQR
ncbi:alpha-N-acetylgalactosaminide alpha-2,6-sialyltransferase 2 isoform X2 [Bos javanicus]|uniref:alpha-N-acetylgalactosaminide alpha-2,6-sialyltransferase 2 isoform X2 n=1 Tax=Bos javanicus TaxID=9906 RepID=UPI002AA63026|nr:alpha-N-acetylgalactosaminide alpha-2,6-sialyltransferase 2 isoform X2 [Bos javanicus]